MFLLSISPICIYTVFSSYSTPNFFQYYQLIVNEKLNFKLGLLYLSIWYVLNDALKQLQEILSFSYFPSFYKFLMHFMTYLMLSSTLNTLFKIACIYSFRFTEPLIVLLCGLFHFRTWHFVIKCICMHENG